jgi:hypothetical protein
MHGCVDGSANGSRPGDKTGSTEERSIVPWHFLSLFFLVSSLPLSRIIQLLFLQIFLSTLCTSLLSPPLSLHSPAKWRLTPVLWHLIVQSVSQLLDQSYLSKLHSKWSVHYSKIPEISIVLCMCTVGLSNIVWPESVGRTLEHPYYIPYPGEATVSLISHHHHIPHIFRLFR